MTDISKPAETAVYSDDVAAPSWQDLRDGGAVVIDYKDQKLAVYCGYMGAVVLATQEHDDPVIRFTVIDHDFIPSFVAALLKAQGEAAVIAAEWEAKYEAVEAQQREGEA